MKPMKIAFAAVAAPMLTAPLALAPAVAVAQETAGKGEHRGDKWRHMKGEMFDGVSEEGKAVIQETMRQAHDPEHREQQRATRQRVLELMAADTLDVRALDAAFAEERAIEEQHQLARQNTMMDGLQRLSAADRKAFVANLQEIDEKRKARWESRKERWKQRSAN